MRIVRSRKFARGWAAIIGLAGLCATAPASAAGVDASARYVVSLGGMNIASVAIDFEENGSNYSIDVGANVAGIGSLVASGTASAASSGRGHRSVTVWYLIGVVPYRNWTS